MSYKPIENYGIIGDLNTIALVGLDGAIDFLCYPTLDAPSVFAALLDDEKGGFFRIAPEFEDARQTQLYVPDTNVLLTRFMSYQGILEITDFMPVPEDRDRPSRIVRMVRAVRGRVPVAMACRPAFDYGRSRPDVRVEDNGHTAFFSGDIAPDGRMRLHADREMKIDETESGVDCRFALETGEQAFFILDCGKADGDLSRACIETLHDKTIAYWQGWVGQVSYRGRWRDIVNRSALVLKLLTSRRYGSIAAAATFGLPEAIGGRRNWDYRYSWIRDSAFTAYAFVRLGLKEEAVAFMAWIEKIYKDAQNQDGTLQLMYRLDGTTELEERTLDRFEGYKGSRPVRVGNDAFKQFQLDLYGELLDCIALADNHITKISHDAWRNICKSVEYVCENWAQADAGIWEFRGERREFLHSRLMCWVALDRALRLADSESLPAPRERWHNVRSAIYEDIFKNFWDDDLQSFVQHKDTKALDAAVLLMPLVNFIGARDPRWLSTLAAVEKYLACDALVQRYRIDDIDLEPIDSSHEGSFNACSFWYIACLARSGQKEKAELLFSKMTGYANHLGLYAEETGGDGRQLGNFPQAFTHLTLINAVIALTEAEHTERAPTE